MIDSKTPDFAPYYDPLPVGIAIFSKGKLVYENPWFTHFSNQAQGGMGTEGDSRETLIAGIGKRLQQKSWLIRSLNPSSQGSANDYANVCRVSVSSLLGVSKKGHSLKVATVTSLSEISDESNFVAGDQRSFVFAHLRVDAEQRIAYYGRRLLHLSPLEINLLLFFCQHEGRLLSKSDLMRKVWRSSVVDSRSVDMTISRLRTKLADAGCEQPKIVTLRGQGVIFGRFSDE